MSNILALETATDACSAALCVRDDILARFEIAPRRHTDLILPMVAALLADAALTPAHLDAIAFGAGPGSFTGVRIATSIAQGLALAHDTPLIPLSCLALLAAGGAREHDCEIVVPISDARKGEIYSAIYHVDPETGIPACVSDDRIGLPASFAVPSQRDYVIVGNAAECYRHAIVERSGAPDAIRSSPRFPDARDAFALARAALDAGRALAPELARPIYLRRAV